MTSVSHAVRNPLGFTCQPNECDPQYQTETDIRRFVAYGLLLSHDTMHGAYLPGTLAHDFEVRELRESFLRAVEIASEVVRHRLYGPYQGDQPDGVLVLSEGKEIYLRWTVEFFHDDGSVMLDLEDGAEGLLVWVHKDALADERFDSVLEEARSALAGMVAV